MGTRHLIAVMHNGEYKLANYGQWDGYPEGQGIKVLDFLKTKFERYSFIKKLDDHVLADGEKISNLFLAFKDAIQTDKNDRKVQDLFLGFFPFLSRDVGGDILDMIQDSTFIFTVSDIDFANNSLFCEWAYVLDLDNNTFEVYEGFNKSPLTKDDRFYSESFLPKDEYYPVKLVKTYSIYDLPTEEQFIKDLVKEDNE